MTWRESAANAADVRDSEALVCPIADIPATAGHSIAEGSRVLSQQPTYGKKVPQPGRGCEMTEHSKALLNWAASESRMTTDAILAEVGVDTLSDHGWPRFLPSELNDEWSALSLDARIIAFAFAFERFDGFDADTSLL